MRRLVALGAGSLMLLLACNRGPSDAPNAGRVVLPEARLAELSAAEFARDATKLSVVDLTHRNPEHRRHAARALARIGGEGTLGLLEHALHDEDREVVAWAAFGMGRLCSGKNARELTLAMVARAGSLSLGTSNFNTTGGLDPFYALGTALGRCATDEAEAALRSWLHVSPELARHAALGLVTLATSRKRLEDPTIVALLDAADRYRAFAIATLPLTRLENVEPTVARRLVTLAPRLLESSGEERRFLIRALELASTQAIAILERIVKGDAQYRPAERAEALRVLGKLGPDGQASLVGLLPRVARPDLTPNVAWLLGSDFAVLVELLTQLRVADAGAKELLSKLARLANGQGESKAKSLRLDWLRCHAASLVAGDDFTQPLLDSCAEIEGSREGKLARLRVLSSTRLRGKALHRFDALFEDADALVRLEALKVLAAHDELRDRAERLVLALSDKSMGVVATAAELLSKRPELALRGERPTPDLLEALTHAISASLPEDAVQLRASLIDAVGALAVLSAKPQLNEACGALSPRLRERAEQALHRLGEPKRSCAEPTQKKHSAPDISKLRGEVILTFRTELSPLELRLDPSLAPFAVERLVTLARAGFYDGISVHRVVPGFVVQLGDKAGDGYGGAGMAPIPCELAPVPFATFDVGMALSGSDSGSSQFFVMLGPYPQLGQDYTRVGRAGTGWERLTVGDIVQKVELSP